MEKDAPATTGGCSPPESIAERNRREEAEVAENLAEHGSVGNPYGDGAARISYLQAEDGGSGRARFFERMDKLQRERLGLDRATALLQTIWKVGQGAEAVQEECMLDDRGPRAAPDICIGTSFGARLDLTLAA